jgi:hypothetical protein
MKTTACHCVLLLTLLLSTAASAEELLRDPTRPLALGGDSGNLNEIIISPQRQVAVIGEHEYRVGDEYGGITVLAIGPNTVKIKQDNEESTLNLFTSPLSPAVKTPTGQK